ncbi:hypothetical protein EVAR_48606_1 [Eumeta japonica]|uniref:Uncharacterized protein n=1 Tax=Eumeta variegata TaxID=151549 RepID=A0A4C1Y0B1_EUMVA|nr:hypothetical protein EVAR_48606_1 [Eumeta japonica]
MRSGIRELCIYFVFGELPEFTKPANSDVYGVIEFIPKTFEFRCDKNNLLIKVTVDHFALVLSRARWSVRPPSTGLSGSAIAARPNTDGVMKPIVTMSKDVRAVWKGRGKVDGRTKSVERMYVMEGSSFPKSVRRMGVEVAGIKAAVASAPAFTFSGARWPLTILLRRNVFLKPDARGHVRPSRSGEAFVWIESHLINCSCHIRSHAALAQKGYRTARAPGARPSAAAGATTRPRIASAPTGRDAGASDTLPRVSSVDIDSIRRIATLFLERLNRKNGIVLGASMWRFGVVSWCGVMFTTIGMRC